MGRLSMTWCCTSCRRTTILIVINAGTREKDVQWVRQSRSATCRACTSMISSDYYTQLAIQGPKAEETLQKLTLDAI